MIGSASARPQGIAHPMLRRPVIKARRLLLVMPLDRQAIVRAEGAGQGLDQRVTEL